MGAAGGGSDADADPAIDDDDDAKLLLVLVEPSSSPSASIASEECEDCRSGSLGPASLGETVEGAGGDGVALASSRSASSSILSNSACKSAGTRIFSSELNLRLGSWGGAGCWWCTCVLSCLLLSQAQELPSERDELLALTTA